ncbi:MAG: peptidoglycan-binding protein [Paludibaculum sp.]
MEILRQGSRAMQVKLLQRLLNNKGAAPRLAEDGDFGPRTRAAVIAFQAKERIPQDGVAGPMTWTRLGITIDITHPVQLFPQPTGMTCWSAAATMIVGNMSIGPGRATLTASGGLEPSASNIEQFGRGLGWRMHYPQTWTVAGLAGLLRNRPVWAVGGGVGWLHAIVISGMWSDGAGDASGTMIRIHDPWPPNVGSVYGRFYRGTVDGFDFISMYILQPV